MDWSAEGLASLFTYHFPRWQSTSRFQQQFGHMKLTTCMVYGKNIQKKTAGKQPASLLLNHCQQESSQATFYPRIAKLYLIVFGNL